MKVRKSVKNAMQLLHIQKLRRNQLKPINSILDGRDTLLIAPTSFGKSLVYLIPAVVQSQSLTIVIEPLLSLIHDQVDKLHRLDIAAAYLDSTQSKQEQNKVRKQLEKQKLSILYIAPERLEFLPPELYENTIDIIAVDECHCVTSWGYSFRDAYLRIGDFIDSLEKRPVVVAMTATAPPEDRSQIMTLLNMKDAQCFSVSLYRSNLHFLKRAAASRKEQQKALKKCMNKYHKNTTIVYCTTKHAVEQVAAYLNKLYPDDVITYHSENKKGEKAMLSGKKHIIVATTALSMGIDIQGVDLVIHFNMPMSLADYYQMAGRGGREGQTSRSILLYNPDDYWVNYSMLNKIADPKARERALSHLDAMKEFCEDTEHCMVSVLLSALGEQHASACRYCTNCQKGR